MPKDQPARLRYPWEEPPTHGEAIEVAPGVLWTRLGTFDQSTLVWTED